MAFFGVTKEKIETVKQHPNADRLELGKLVGLSFQFVLPKGVYHAGDEVLYFPVDSLIPIELVKKMGLEGKLSGAEKNRVKTIKLRNEISQGIVANISLADGVTDFTPETLTEFLGVTKYEPPTIMCKGANLLPLPLGLTAYDIEGCDRFESVTNSLMDKKVFITEKAEGMNFSISYEPNFDKIFVNQRNFTIQEIEGCEHSFWKVVRELELDVKVKQIENELYTLSSEKKAVTIYGEFLGPSVQGNIYKFTKHTIMVFDIKYGDKFVSFNLFHELTRRHNIQTVPILSDDTTLREWLNGKTVQEASNGKSVLFDTLREGIVIKPLIEEYNVELRGRLILKQRSPEYLNKSDN